MEADTDNLVITALDPTDDVTGINVNFTDNDGALAVT